MDKDEAKKLLTTWDDEEEYLVLPRSVLRDLTVDDFPNGVSIEMVKKKTV